MSKLKMLQPRLKEVDLTRGLKVISCPYPPKPTLRWTKDTNGRTLPLTSDAWRKLRRHVLMGEPLCRMCTARGLTVVATDVDHRDNDPSNNDLLNLQPLCHECHSRKTNRDMGHNVRMGCDTEGKPLDPHHHWNNATETNLMRPVVSPVCQPLTKSPATGAHKPAVLSSLNANC